MSITEKHIDLIRNGGLVIFPTETIYGIGCRADDAAALERLFAAKGRRPDQPPPVLVSGEAQLNQLVVAVPEAARELMNRHWPGGLTLILPARAGLPSLLTGGGNTVGVRQSAHLIACALCEAAGAPIVATSANRSGANGAAAAPRSLADIDSALLAAVDVVLDGGPVGGTPSTVVDCTIDPPRVLRQGAVQL